MPQSRMYRAKNVIPETHLDAINILLAIYYQPSPFCLSLQIEVIILLRFDAY